MFNEEKLSRNVFDNLSEADIMFITNPGRLGDVAGVTLIAYQENLYKIYRVDSSSEVSIMDLLNKYSLWKDMWDNSRDQTFNSKYQYINLGYGNGLMIDHLIYDTFYPYYLEVINKDKEENKNRLYAWKDAFIKMINNA